MTNDFYSFTKNQSFTHFQEWLRDIPNVDRLEKLRTDKNGHQLYAMFYQREKRGLVRIPIDLVETHEQKLIDQVKAQFNHMNKVRIAVGTRRTQEA